ncbi:sigma-70 family RNA polymerase sigma factor [Pseudoalteromonas sp. S16_S37]|uniref:sigma-70 family RNA polymerase sigma factor n=1 Tax=Pseudoalteromonas sp. S16_S37 TaxID=2720228 RepID=UPI0016815BF9|nr:sigma-70 family RNA polymerase sigma factor [Pseudoalteromonas sp. S16_S37]MBD1584028.1 sigma-70 family RNA polymerase sigma factor [Pseudoalteromonas sp. S16_S37]
MLIALKSWFTDQAPPDDALLAYKQSGNNRYLELLIEQYSQDLYHFLRSHSNDALAHDICQKTWLTTMEKKHLYEASHSPKAWLFKIARNALFDEIRRQRQGCALDEHTLVDTQAVSTQAVSEPTTNLSAAIEQLPFLQKEALSLQLEDFSLKEIAQITQSNTETIKTRLRYARQQLKQVLGENHER